VPTENSSSERRRQGHITKCGNAHAPNPQPYQRDGAQLPLAAPSFAMEFDVEVI